MFDFETGIKEIVLDLVENYRLVINSFKKDFKNIELNVLEIQIDGRIFDLDDFKGEAKYAIDALTSEIMMLGGDVEKCLFKVQNILNQKEDIESGYDEWRILEPKEYDYDEMVREISELYRQILRLISAENTKVCFAFGISERFLVDGRDFDFEKIDFELEKNKELADIMCNINQIIIALEFETPEEDILSDVEKILNGDKQ